jgi:hypothetical protein
MGPSMRKMIKMKQWESTPGEHVHQQLLEFRASQSGTTAIPLNRVYNAVSELPDATTWSA